MPNEELQQAIAWFENRLSAAVMPGAREMFGIAISAIREKLEHENPQPLTLDELREMDGQLYTVHDVAVILANVIGDDCACNINSNDEWLPQVCELQEACPKPDGVACWEQYLKHRAEAEEVLGKESQA